MAALAQVSDVQVAMGRELTVVETARVEFLLELLSDKFRAEAQQSFAVESFEHRIKVNGCHVTPRRTPLVSVSSVVDDAGVAVPWTMGEGFVHVNLPSDRFVVMTYTAGLTDVPVVVRHQIADSARRILSIAPAAIEGRTQVSQTAGPYSEQSQFATWAVGGQAMLSPDDIALARKFRPRRAGNVWVA